MFFDDEPGRFWRIIFVLTIGLALILSTLGITRTQPNLMIPDGYSNAIRAIQKIKTGDLLQPVFKKGGNLHVNLLTLVYLPGAYFSKWFRGTPIPTDVHYYYVIGRILSVVAALGILLVTTKTASKLFNARSGILACLLLSVSMGFLYHAHFATEDIVMTFLLALSVYLLVQFRLESNRPFLYAGAFTTGLAISAKASAGLLVIPYGWTIVSLSFINSTSGSVPLYRRRINPKPFLGYSILVFGLFLLGYVLTTPSIVFLPIKSLRYIFVEAIFRWNYRGFQQPWPSPVIASYYLARSFGLPLFLLVVGGFASSLRKWATNGETRGLTVLHLFLLPYLAVVFTWDAIGDWVMLPALPFLVVLTGNFVDGCLRDKRSRLPAFIVCGLILLFSFYYALFGVQKFRKDSRIKATQWFKARLEPRSEVDAYSWKRYLPGFPESVKVLPVPLLNGPSRPWYLARYRLRKRSPDYIVLVSSQYDRYFRDPEAFPEITRTFQKLLDEEFPYAIRKRFGPPVITEYTASHLILSTVYPRAMHPINPSIILLKRKTNGRGSPTKNAENSRKNTRKRSEPATESSP